MASLWSLGPVKMKAESLLCPRAMKILEDRAVDKIAEELRKRAGAMSINQSSDDSI